MSSFFRSLTRGVKFNTDRFLDDALKLRVIKQPQSAGIQPEQVELKEKAKHPEKRKRPKLEAPADDGEDDDDIPIFKKGKLEEVEVKEEDADKNKKKKKKGKALTLKQKQEEEIRQLRRSFSIYAYGSDIPAPVPDFKSIPGVTEQMLTNIGNCGYEVPTAVQMQAIPILMKGRELLACAPTGSGKSAAFLIPTILQLQGSTADGVRAVIVSPTKELAGQIHRECVRLAVGTGLRIFNLSSSAPAPALGKNKKKAGKKHPKSPAKADILITTPNRLVYALKPENPTEEKFDLAQIQLLIVDECDNLFEDKFQDQLGIIYSACSSAPGVRRAFFSATCTHRVELFCRSHLDNHVQVSVGIRNSAVDQIDQSIIFVGDEAGKLVELRNTIRKGLQAPVLLFVQSQERADELLQELQSSGSIAQALHCGVIHSGKNEAARERTIEEFRTGKIWILICTALLARGMDFPAVRTVINYDMPASHLQYIHSVGRTGRAGRTGKAITFFTEVDRENLARIAQILKNSGFPIPPFVFKLRKARRGEARVPKRKHISRRAAQELKKKKWKKQGKKLQKEQKKMKNSKSPPAAP